MDCVWHAQDTSDVLLITGALSAMGTICAVDALQLLTDCKFSVL